MRTGLGVGEKAELHWRVSAEQVIHLGYPAPTLGSENLGKTRSATATSAVVFSTPNMILLMERTARKVLEPFLEPGEESVGALVNVEHLAGTPLGADVRGEAVVTQIDGRAVDFQIAAYDRLEMIGRGTHRRVVVNLDRVASRISEKALKLSLASNPSHLEMPAELPALATLQIDIQGPLAIVTLNRPAKKNAVNVQMTEDWERLTAYLYQHPEIRVVILQGAGAAFCAGDDIPEVGTLDLVTAQELSYRQARVYLSWEQLPQVFIAAVDGEAYGAGCVVACACDLRVASHNARFGMPEILLGWPPGYGIAQLTALIGKGRAMEMCLGGQSISARQAAEWGLVHRLSSTAGLLGDAKKWAEQLLALSADALSETKRLLHADEGLQPKTAYLADTAAYIRCLQHADAQEGIAAFKEKRPPKFNR